MMLDILSSEGVGILLHESKFPQNRLGQQLAFIFALIVLSEETVYANISLL